MGGGLGWGLVLQRTERTLVAGVEERNMDEIKRERGGYFAVVVE